MKLNEFFEKEPKVIRTVEFDDHGNAKESPEEIRNWESI